MSYSLNNVNNFLLDCFHTYKTTKVLRAISTALLPHRKSPEVFRSKRGLVSNELKMEPRVGLLNIVMNSHKLSGLKQQTYSLMGLGAGSPKSATARLQSGFFRRTELPWML